MSDRLKLVEIHREDIDGLPALMGLLRNAPHPFLLFCDDLSFDADDTSYKSLKAVLEGGIEGRPPNVLFYATSNRRHLLPRDMMDNERATAINPGEAIEEKVSLSDRFGLWLGFPQMLAGRVPRHGRGLCHPFRPWIDARNAGPGSARMGDNTRQPLRPDGRGSSSRTWRVAWTSGWLKFRTQTRHESDAFWIWAARVSNDATSLRPCPRGRPFAVRLPASRPQLRIFRRQRCRRTT